MLRWLDAVMEIDGFLYGKTWLVNDFESLEKSAFFG